MSDALSTENESALKQAWDQHHAAIRVIREHLAKTGATIQVDIFIRDRAASERRAKRLARARR